MPLITLLKKGSLISNFDDPADQEKLNEWVPMEYVMNWFRERIAKNEAGLHNRVLIFRSETASGKSTAFPPNLYRNFFVAGKGGIAVTQPRVLNVLSIVKDQILAGGFYPYLKLGESIGYQTGPAKELPKFGITYMTVGVLSMIFKFRSDEEIMTRYRFIIIDEVHEASIELAILIYYIKNFCLRNADNPRMPFIVMTSATFDTTKYLKYFGVWNAPTQPNLIQVRGFAYPLEDKWELERPVDNFIEAAISRAKYIHETFADDPENADILIFMPGMSEIKQVYDKLTDYNEKRHAAGQSVFLLLSIDSETVAKGKRDILLLNESPENLHVQFGRKKERPIRRIIISTSVAETGVTIDNLKYVIDTGFARGPEYNGIYDVSGIMTKPAQKSRIRQRMGRANRKSPGVFYPLYTKMIYNNLEENQLADIETSDVGQYILAILLEQMKGKALRKEKEIVNFRDIDMIDVPPQETLHLNLEKIFSLGFIAADYSITRMGMLASKMNRLSLEQVRMIFAGYLWGISPLNMASIAAYLSIGYVDIIDRDDINWIKIYSDGLPEHFTTTSGDGAIYRYRLLIGDNFIDGMVIINAVTKLLNKCRLAADAAFAQGEPIYCNFAEVIGDWCEKVGLKYHVVMSLLEVRDDIIENMLAIGLSLAGGDDLMSVPQTSFIDVVTKIKYCIYEGYRLNLATYDSAANLYRTQNGLEIISPALFAKNEVNAANEKKYGIALSARPKYILYDKLEFKYNRATSLYSIVTNRVSIMDGYVKMDFNFV